MRFRPIALLACLLAGLLGCTSGPPDAAGPAASTESTVTTVPAPEAPVEPAFTMFVPRCLELADPSDSLDWTGAQRSDAPDPFLTEQALSFAWQFPHYVATWGPPQREGWFVVGVSGGAVELQADLDARYPAARVMAMPIDWNETELSGLASLVEATVAAAGVEAAVTWSMSRGLVLVDLGEINEATIAPLEPFTDDPRLCVTGELAAT